MDTNIITYGVNERTVCFSDLDKKVEEFNLRGFTFLDSGLDKIQCLGLKNKLISAYQKQVSEIGGEKVIESIGDKNIIRCPLASDNSFLDVATNEALMSFAEAILGKNYILLMQNGVFNEPSNDQYQMGWHRDLNYQHWVSSKPIALNAMLCLDPFNEITGGTYLLPYSQHFPLFPSDDFVRSQQIVPDVAEGTFIVMNAMVFHRTGYNLSSSARFGLNHVIGLPFLAQQIDIPRYAPHLYSLEDSVRNQYLGYKWNPVESVELWRKRRC